MNTSITTRQRSAFVEAKLYKLSANGEGMDFDVFAGPITRSINPLFAQQIPNPPETAITMIGSSTIEDLAGDTMDNDALQCMTRVDPHLSLFLNHDYTLPESLYGSLLCPPMIVVQQNIADLYLAGDTETTNPRAMATLGYIHKGRRLGTSGGFKVTDFSVKGDEDDWFAPLIIHGVIAVEFSIVGVPANQRSWVECAALGLFTSMIIEDNGEVAKRLAPIVRQLYPNTYKAIVNQTLSEGLQQDLLRVKARPNPGPGKLLWEPPSRSFVLQYGPEEVALTPAQIQTLREKRASEYTTSLKGESALSLYLKQLMHKAATGKTSWPLADQDTAWDGSAAEKDIFDWAADSSEGGFSPSQAKQCFFYCDTSQQELRGAYKLPFCKRVGGDMHIIFKGVQAVAGVLSGARGGVKGIPDDEIATIKHKIETIYRRAAKQFGDPELVPPWKKEDSIDDANLLQEDEGSDEEDGAEETMTKKAGTGASTTTDPTPNTGAGANSSTSESGTDLEEKSQLPDIKDLKVAADGSHDKTTGTHSHSHPAYGSQGGDETHSHSHSHENDNTHEHSHDNAEKGTHSEDLTTTSTPAPAPAPAMTTTEDPLRTYRITMIGTLLKELELPSLDALLKGYLPDKQATGAKFSKETTATHQELHDKLSAMHPNGSGGSKLCDSMGKGGDGDGDEDDGEGSHGKQPGQSTDDAEQEAKTQREMTASFTKQVQATLTVLKDFPGVELKTFKDHLLFLQGEAQTTQAQMQVAQKAVNDVLAEAERVKKEITDLTNMPMGRPTQLNRSVTDTIGTVTREQLLQLSQQQGSEQAAGYPVSWKQAESLTSIVSVEVEERSLSGEICKTPVYYREWSAGLVPEGGRPPLTGEQQSRMHPFAVMDYNEGRKARVPMIDDPFEKARMRVNG